MPVKKLSIALDEAVEERAREAADAAGLSFSAWVNATLDRALRIREGLIAVDQWEAEHGPLSEADLAAAQAVVARATKIKPHQVDF